MLNALGYGVHLLEREKCCGVALIANGLYDQARRQALTNMESIRRSVTGERRPVIVASSTCTFTMRDEYPHVLGVGNEDVRDGIDLVTRFVYRIIDSGEARLRFRDDVRMKAAYHTACHMERLGWSCYSIALLRMIPTLELTLLPSQCCGIAGTYGFKRRTTPSRRASAPRSSRRSSRPTPSGWSRSAKRAMADRDVHLAAGAAPDQRAGPDARPRGNRRTEQQETVT